MRNGDDFSPTVIDRIAGLLNEFSDGAELTLSELAVRTGLPRSSVHRLLAQLVDVGWISKRGKAYALSRSMIEWGGLAQQHDALYQAAHPVLHALHATTGLIAHLAILDGGDVRYLDKVGRGPDHLPSRVGGRQPALRTALGKAILAHSGSAGAVLRDATQTLGPVHQERLRHEIAEIRHRHVAHERNEAVPGIACIAAPIGHRPGCVGAISLTGPAERLNAVALTTPVRSAAQTIWQNLASRSRQRTSA